MKRMKRWIAVILAALLCVTLCGCQKLENMRADHAKLQADGTIVWNGNVYRRMVVTPDEVDPLTSENIVVTEADVPVLLSGLLGESGEVSLNGVWLNFYQKPDYEWMLYCREDVYEQMLAYMEQCVLSGDVPMDMYYYSYYSMESERRENYFLSAEQKQVIDTVLATAEPVSTEKDFYERIQFKHNISLNGCDQYQAFHEYQVVEIVVATGRYFLVQGVEELMSDPDGEVTYVDTTYYAYRVPSEYNAVMDKIVEVYGDKGVAHYYE